DRPNGLCFSRDGRRLFINDTARKHIRVFDVKADGGLTGGRVWAETTGEGKGAPDGMKIDSAGNVYCCGPGGGHGFDPAAGSPRRPSPGAMTTTAVSTSPHPRPCTGSASRSRACPPCSAERPPKEAVMTRLLTLLVAALLALPAAAEAQKPIKVGMPIPLSGPAALFGDPASKGAQMYVDELNAKGGVLGRKIELIIRDSKADANEAVRVARELILKENVDFLVGTLTSAE